MTKASTSARADELERAEIWAVSTYDVGSGPVPFEIGYADIARDTRWVKGILAEHGVSRGTHVLVVSGGWEQPWFAPIVRAIGELGGIHVASEIWAFDAPRLDALLRLLPIQLVVGLDGAATRALAARVDLHDVLAGVDVVIARPDAVPLLRSAGIAVCPLALLGPALAIGRPGSSGAVVDTQEWAVSEEDGELRLTTVGRRRHVVTDLPLGSCQPDEHLLGQLLDPVDDEGGPDS